jgi:hypothetical protein
MEHLKTTKPKARKKHQCDYCQGIVEKGEIYQRDVFVTEGTVYNWISHLYCEKLSEKMQAHDDYNTNEGVSHGQFEQFVYEECKERGFTSLTFLQKIAFLGKEFGLQ